MVEGEAFGKKKSAVSVIKIFPQHHPGLQRIDFDFSHRVSFFERNVFRLYT